MIDLYVDDVELEYIKDVSPNEHVLVLTNRDKDEQLSLAVDGDELVNIYRKIRMRLETLGLKNPGEELQ